MQTRSLQCSSIILQKKHEFENKISEFRRKINTIDENFLMELSITLQLKTCIFSQQISSFVLIISTAAIATKKPELAEKQQINGNSFLRVEQLSDIIQEYKTEVCLKMVQPEMVGWSSKVWDRLVYSSCFRNYIDLLVLYYFIGQSLLQNQKELRRLAKLLLVSFNKIKTIQQDTINLTIFILDYLVVLCEIKHFSYDLTLRLKILKLLYLSKIEKRTEKDNKVIQVSLEEFASFQLQNFVQYLSKIEEAGVVKEEDTIWDRLFVTVLRTFHNIKAFQSISKKILIEMLNFRIDMQTVKLMIRQLQVNNQTDPCEKWKQIFSILEATVKIYDKPKTVIMFATQKSYLKMPLNAGKNFLMQIKLKNSWKTYQEQKFLMMIQDKDQKQELWVTSINEKEGQLKLMLLKVINKSIMQQTQQHLIWSQNTTSKFAITFSPSEIKIQVNGITKNTVSIQRFISNPAYIVIGDCQETLGTSVKYFLSLSIAPESQIQNDLICYVLDLNSKTFEYKGLKKKVIPSFVELFTALGDLDIFLLVVSHAFKRMKTDPLVTSMIRYAMSMLDSFVQVKHVEKQPLKPHERLQRLNAILCLSWQCSHQTRNALAVFQLLRVLTIRGIPNPEDELEVLCNFAFWKHFDWEYQRLIILKIKQIMISYRFHDLYLKPLHKYCKRIVMETVLYYREEDLILTSQSQDREFILRIHYEFCLLLEQQMSHQIKSNKEPKLIYDFLEFLIKIISLTISRRSYSNIEAFDLTLAIQLSILARSIGEKLTQWTGIQGQLLKLIVCITQTCEIYDVQQYYFFEKKLKLFRGEGFVQYEESTIKTNLYFLAYQLVSLRPHLLFVMSELQIKGSSQITCIGWQKQFFDKILIKAKDKSYVYESKEDKIENIMQIYQNLPLKYMSIEQNESLLKLYLNNDRIFPQIDFKLSNHFWNLIGIKGVLNSLLRQIHANSIEQSQKTQSSRIETYSCMNISLFNKKILSLLIVCSQLTGQEGLTIINTMNVCFGLSNAEQFVLVKHHFVLRGLIEKTRKMMSSQLQLFIPLHSCIDFEAKSPALTHAQSSIQQSSVPITREQYTKCIEYYYSQITLKDMMQVKGISDSEEGQGHLENCKLQLSIMMNHLSSHHNNSMNQLKKYYQFLEVQILPLSQYYLELYKIVPIYTEPEKLLKRKSKGTLDFPQLDLKEQTKDIYIRFMDERNQNILKVEKVWHKIQQRNKYFWSTFMPKETVYSLHEITGSLNEKYLLKKNNKREKLQLPRMAKTSIMKSTSLMSEKFQFDQNESVSSIFDDARMYKKESAVCLSFEKDSPSKEGKVNKFNVVLITNAKLYQGILTLSPLKLGFEQNEYINEDLYKKLCACDVQMRTEDECIIQNYKFEEDLSSKSCAVVKRYLFLDIGLEITTKNRSFFFVFMKRDHRQACLLMLERHIKVLRKDGIHEESKYLCERWQNGQISNFAYLMHVNNLVGRSFNDLSQYYIFPWTVTNFQDILDLQFFKKKQNFRDLTLPVGKLSKSKWENIKKNYERTKNDQIPGIKPFLYGSFYSNPAIVSNFLIRINPFASQHFQLQSKQFDLPDRLFYSISDSYKSLIMSSSDFKELIPQFYFFPEFLKNRNEYNLGSRQNKDIVNNVILPAWAHDQYEFVYRMRKFLQCSQMTNTLHGWIDLIFGVYSKKEYALKADNLFLDQLYVNSFEAQCKEKNKDFMMYFKQFGQVPIPLFNSNHPPAKALSNCLDRITHPSVRIQETQLQSLHCGKLLQICFVKNFTLFLFQRQIRMYSDQKYGEKDFAAIVGQFQGSSIRFWEMSDQKEKKHYCILLHKKKTLELLAFEIKKTIFGKFSIQGGQALQLKHRVQQFVIYDNILICAQGKNIFMYRNIQEETNEEYSSLNNCFIQTINKAKYLLAIGCQFTQHKSRIVFLGATQRGMIVSVDQESKVYIIEVHSGKVVIYNFFQIRSTCFEENIAEIIVHPHGFIILRTDRERILMYTFLGDKVVDQILLFKKRTQNAFTEKIQTMCLWNLEFIEMIVGTNLGNIWKLDLFALRKKEQIAQTEIWIQKIYLNRQGFRKQSILKIANDRLGRHSMTLAFGENNKLYVLKSQKWDQVRKALILRKKPK